jgi:hypothetical protein
VSGMTALVMQFPAQEIGDAGRGNSDAFHTYKPV